MNCQKTSSSHPTLMSSTWSVQMKSDSLAEVPLTLGCLSCTQPVAPNFWNAMSSFIPKHRGASTLRVPGLMLDRTSAAGLTSSNPGNFRRISTESGSSSKLTNRSGSPVAAASSSYGTPFQERLFNINGGNSLPLMSSIRHNKVSS